MTEKAAPPKNAGVGSGTWESAALAGSAILVFGAAAASVAALRGPLSLETLALVLGRAPRPVWPMLALLAGAPAVVAAASLDRRLGERLIAALAVLAGAMLAWKLPSPWPRASFDEWESSFAVTQGGVPWSAVLAMSLAAFLALSFALTVRRAVLSRGAADSSRLSGLIAVVALLAFALPASATISLATGTRLLPVGEPDELWAPAFAGAACPPINDAPKASPSVAPSAPKR